MSEFRPSTWTGGKRSVQAIRTPKSAASAPAPTEVTQDDDEQTATADLSAVIDGNVAEVTPRIKALNSTDELDEVARLESSGAFPARQGVLKLIDKRRAELTAGAA